MSIGIIQSAYNNVWFTSDWHLGHYNIIDLCRRPFKDIQTMERRLIANYCSVVGESDTCFFVGDMFFQDKRTYEQIKNILKKLPGRKIFVLGNHDRCNPFDYVDAGFESVHTYFEFENFGIVHDPAISVIDIEKKFICGHVHGLWTRCANAYNVSVERHNYKPVNFETIAQDFCGTEINGGAI